MIFVGGVWMLVSYGFVYLGGVLEVNLNSKVIFNMNNLNGYVWFFI